jgi:hypothetical protein
MNSCRDFQDHKKTFFRIHFAGLEKACAGQALAHLQNFGPGGDLLQIDTNGDGLMDIGLQNFTGTLNTSNFLLSQGSRRFTRIVMEAARGFFREAAIWSRTV